MAVDCKTRQPTTEADGITSQRYGVIDPFVVISHASDYSMGWGSSADVSPRRLMTRDNAAFPWVWRARRATIRRLSACRGKRR